MPQYEIQSGKFDLGTGYEVATPGDTIELTERQEQVFNANRSARLQKVSDDDDLGVESDEVNRTPDQAHEVAEGVVDPATFDSIDGTPTEFLDEFNANEVRSEIQQGNADADLEGIERAEREKDEEDRRKTVLDAIEKRREQLGIE